MATSRRTTEEPTRRIRGYRSSRGRTPLSAHARPCGTNGSVERRADVGDVQSAGCAHRSCVLHRWRKEGDLQNPALREPGQPFHGLTPEEEKERLAELRPSELAEVCRDDRFRRRRDAWISSRIRDGPAIRLVQPSTDGRAVGRLVGVSVPSTPTSSSPTAMIRAATPYPRLLGARLGRALGAPSRVSRISVEESVRYRRGQGRLTAYII